MPLKCGVLIKEIQLKDYILIILKLLGIKLPLILWYMQADLGRLPLRTFRVLNMTRVFNVIKY